MCLLQHFIDMVFLIGIGNDIHLEVTLPSCANIC